MARQPRRSNVKASAQRSEILRAAAALFAEKGFGGTKLNDITEAVGVTRPAFYYYFASKEELLGALAEEVTFKIERHSAAFLAQTQISPPILLQKAVVDYATRILSNTTEFRFLSTTESDLPPPIRQTHALARRSVLRSFVGIIDLGIKSGHFALPDATVAAFAIIGMCNWGAWWFKESGHHSVAEIADILAQFALRVVASHSREGRPEDLRASMFAEIRERLDYLEKTTVADAAPLSDVKPSAPKPGRKRKTDP